jgi:hypothetical protein
MLKMSQIRQLRIDTRQDEDANTLADLATPVIVGKEGLSGIDILPRPPSEGLRIPIKNMLNTQPHSRSFWQEYFWALEAKACEDELCELPEEFDIDTHNLNLLLSSDHEVSDLFERPSWGGMVVYMNAILKLYGITPRVTCTLTIVILESGPRTIFGKSIEKFNGMD